MGNAEKQQVPEALQKYYQARQLSSLRNWGRLAAEWVAHHRKVPVDRVLLHQADDDVLPAHAYSANPSQLHVIPHSWFASAEPVFSRHKTAAVLCGKYLGVPDYGIFSMLEYLVRKAGPDQAASPYSTPESILSNMNAAEKYFHAIARGVDLDAVETFVQPVVKEDFQHAYAYDQSNMHGGVMTFRLDRFGWTPPTPYHGDDIFHVDAVRREGKNAIWAASWRKAYHDKDPAGRDFAQEAKSDWMNQVLKQAYSDWRENNFENSESTLREICAHALGQSMEAGHEALHAENALVHERMALKQAEAQVKKELQTTQNQALKPTLEALDQMRADEKLFRKRARQIRVFFESMGQFSNRRVGSLVRQLREHRKLETLLETHGPTMLALARQMPWDEKAA